MNFKTVLLAAAALGVAGTAQAADLAKKAPAAANYVKVCDAYGAGFFYIPGSDTCLKIGGYVMAQYNMYSHSSDGSLGLGSVAGVAGWHRIENGISTLARAHVSFDARSNTELGLLRSFIEFEANTASYGSITGQNGIVTKKAFVQFGGLTAGRATSFFDFWTGFTEAAYFEAAHSDANVNLLAYTFAFGNGISATLSVEDPSTSDDGGRRNGYLADAAVMGGPTADLSGYGGVHTADLIANVNVTQAWGSAQLMAALHDDNSDVDGINSKLGWAIGGGVMANLPFGVGDKIALQAAYSKGALGYVSPSWANGVDFASSGVVGSSVEQASGWSIAGGLTHGFSKAIALNLEGSYAQYRSDGSAPVKYDFNQWDVQGNVTWTPVNNLALILELEYRNVDYTSDALATLKDASALVGTIRVKRSF